MANKNWLLLTTVICLVAANEFGYTAARPQRNKQETRLIRFRPITREQYDSIMKLTSGKPIISEARLINNGYRSLSSISNSITEDLNNRLRLLLNITGLLTEKTSSDSAKGYPLCVIKTNDVVTDSKERTISESSIDNNNNNNNNKDDDDDKEHRPMGPPMMYYPFPPGGGGGGGGGHPDHGHNNGHDNDDDNDNNDGARPIVNCIVVVKPTTDDEEDNDCEHEHGRDRDGNRRGCRDEYCRRMPWDPRCHRGGDNNDDDKDWDRRRGGSSMYRHGMGPYGFNPYAFYGWPYYPYGAYPQHSSHDRYDRDRSAGASETSRAAANSAKTDRHAAATRRKTTKQRTQTKRINRPAMPEIKRNSPVAATRQAQVGGYDYSQLYQQLQQYNPASYGGALGQAQASYGYNPYAGYQQISPYAAAGADAGAGLGYPGMPNIANLRFPAQFQQQLQPQLYSQFGNAQNYAPQSDSGEYSSGEDSGEDSDEDNYEQGRALSTKTADTAGKEDSKKSEVKKSS